MSSQRLTINRIDPWSVLKFGFVFNLAMLAILLLAARVVWFVVRSLELVDQICSMINQLAELDQCAIDGGGLFWNVFVLGLLSVVVVTGLMVFGTFLLNLIADLTGGLTFGVTGSIVDSGSETATRPEPSKAASKLKEKAGAVAERVAAAAEKKDQPTPGAATPQPARPAVIEASRPSPKPSSAASSGASGPSGSTAMPSPSPATSTPRSDRPSSPPSPARPAATWSGGPGPAKPVTTPTRPTSSGPQTSSPAPAAAPNPPPTPTRQSSDNPGEAEAPLFGNNGPGRSSSFPRTYTPNPKDTD